MIADLAWPLALGLGVFGVGGGLLLGRARVRDEQRSARLQRAWTEYIDDDGLVDDGHAYECSCGRLLVTSEETPVCQGRIRNVEGYGWHEPRVMRMVAEP